MKYFFRIMLMNSQVAAKEIQQWCGYCTSSDSHAYILILPVNM